MNKKLPEFLYKSDGDIKIGWHGDTVCTDEWGKWLDKLVNSVQLTQLKVDNIYWKQQIAETKEEEQNRIIRIIKGRLLIKKIREPIIKMIKE